MRQKSVTVKQIQNLDKVAIEQYGVPSLALMENAGAAIAREIIKQLKGISGPNPVWENGQLILSTPDAIGKALEQHMAEFDLKNPFNDNSSWACCRWCVCVTSIW